MGKLIKCSVNSISCSCETNEEESESTKEKPQLVNRKV